MLRRRGWWRALLAFGLLVVVASCAAPPAPTAVPTPQPVASSGGSAPTPTAPVAAAQAVPTTLPPASATAAPPPATVPPPASAAGSTPAPASAAPTATAVRRAAAPAATAESRQPAATGEMATTPEPAQPTASAAGVGGAPAAVPSAIPTSDSRLTGTVLDPTGKRAGPLRTIAIDPGHGGPETGSAVAADLIEKNLNLKISLILAEMLRADGFRVVLTRDSDRAVSPEFTRAGVFGLVARDLQARVDIANRATSDLFLSVHNNGSGDPGQRGTEVWYNAARTFSDRNVALAEILLAKHMEHLRRIGHSAFNRGIKDDENFRFFRGRAFNIYVLGPGTGARPHTATTMPGVLGESLILSNPGDAAALRRPETLTAIARAYRDAVIAYFEKYP